MRKLFLFLALAIAVSAVVYIGIKYFPAKTEDPPIQTFDTKQNPAYKAVPQKCPLVIEIKNQDGFFDALKGENPLFAELRNIPEVDSLVAGIARFRAFVGARPNTSALLKGKSVIVSVNPSGKNQIADLFLVQLNGSGESSSAVDLVARELGEMYSITRKNYDNTTIVNAKSSKMGFYFACANDIFMASENFILIEEAIRQSNSPNLLNNRQFTEVYRSIDEMAMAQIFINHQTIAQLLTGIVTPETKKTLVQIASFSNWTGLCLWAKQAKLELTGYSATKDSTDNYLNIFRGQEAQMLTIDQVVPANSSYFVALNLKDAGLFIDQYESYLRTSGNYYSREMNLIDLKKKTNIDSKRLMKELVGKQVAGVYGNINKSAPSQNRYFIAELANPSEAKEKLGKIADEFAKSGKGGVGSASEKFIANNKKSFDIYRLPFSNMPECLFGRAFSGIDTRFFVLYDKFLVCGDNLPGMKNYLQYLVDGKTLAKDSVYQLNNKSAQPKPNFSVFAKVPSLFRLKDVFLKPEMCSLLSANEVVVRKLGTFSWQFSTSGDMVQNRLALNFDPTYKEEPQAVWQLKLGGKLARVPVMMLNHRDLSNKELAVCDNQGNLSLIDKEGNILWTVAIPGEIVSDIHQVDLYQNNKFQYMFNTKMQLYCIDRTGKKVGKFPLALKSMASGGLSVAMFGKNKELRFIIPGEDRKIHVFDRDGKLVPKWNFAGTESLASQPVLPVSIDGKDYLIVTDKQNIYILDKQGNLRDGQPSPFSRSANPVCLVNDAGTTRLIASGPDGKVYLNDLAGQTDVKDFGKFGVSHRFVAADIEGKGAIVFIFADGKKLIAFAADGKKLFERSFAASISETPFVCQMGLDGNKIGVVIGSLNKIYLLDKNGAVVRGFPLEGNSSFVLGKFNEANPYYNLLVGSEDGSLVNYKIE